MADSKSVEAALSRLSTLRAASKSPEVIAELRKALSNKSNLVAAKAASVAEHLQASELTEELAAMFRRFMENPAKADTGCVAKTAAVSALYQFAAPVADVYVAGVRHVQPEASWGAPVDTAAELRGISAFGLVRMRYRDALLEILPLLVDQDAQARIAGVRAVAGDGRDEGALLLRLKVLAGDAEPEVIRECLSATLKLSPEKSLAFVAGFLDSPDEALRDAAAHALGTSRLTAAFALLKDEWEHTILPDRKHMLLNTIGQMRIDAAIEFLLERIRDDNRTTALAAIKAMSPHKHDTPFRDRVAAAVAERDETAVTQAFGEQF
jgi:HEAT repeat protein